MYLKRLAAILAVSLMPQIAIATELDIKYDVKSTLLSNSSPARYISKAEIEAINANSLAELLQKTTSFTVYSLGTKTSKTNIRAFGLEDEHVLILLNGSPLTNVTEGEAQLEWIDLATVQGIEYFSLGEGVVFGSGSAGAVINIITGGNSVKDHATINSGTHNLRGFTAAKGLELNASNISIVASYQASSGYDSQPTSQPDNDGFKTGSSTISWTSEDLTAGLSSIDLSTSFTTNEIDNGRLDQNLVDTEITSMRIAGKLNNALNYSIDRSELSTTAYNSDASSKNIYTSDNSGINLVSNYLRSFKFGAEYRLTNYSPGGDAYYALADEQSLFGLFASANTQLMSAGKVSGSLRGEEHSTNGFQSAANLNIELPSETGASSKVTLARSYRYPTLADKAQYDLSWAVSDYNQNLQPEKVSMIAFEYLWPIQVGWIRSKAYRTKTQDFISISQANEGGASSTGLEISAEFLLGALHQNITLSLVKTAVEKYSDTAMAYIPDRQLNYRAEYPYLGGLISLDLHGQSKMYTNYNEQSNYLLSGYAIADVGFSRKFSDINVKANLANAFDKDRELYSGSKSYALPGREFEIELRYEF
jgi:outer membrane cobalamin receptor